MKHLIIIKFNDDFNLNGNIDLIRELFNKSLGIEGVDKIDIYLSNTNKSNRHDLMIEMTLTPEGLEAFDDSEIHKEWKRQYGDYVYSKTIFDYDI